MSIGGRLAELRLEAGLSQTEFAARTGTSQSAFATYERGLRETPVNVVSAACKEFDVSPAWLLWGEGAKRAQSAVELAERAFAVTRDFVQDHPGLLPADKELELFGLSFRYLNEHAGASDEFLHFMLERTAANVR